MLVLTKTIHTTGYQGESVNRFVEKLHGAGITLLVDVRRRPFSRKPGFSKNTLAPRLAEEGIGYIHMQELGMPDDLMPHRSAIDNSPILNEYRARMITDPNRLRELEAVTRDERACLLCFEADHAQCHRGILADFLNADGYAIQHI